MVLGRRRPQHGQGWAGGYDRPKSKVGPSDGRHWGVCSFVIRYESVKPGQKRRREPGIAGFMLLSAVMMRCFGGRRLRELFVDERWRQPTNKRAGVRDEAPGERVYPCR